MEEVVVEPLNEYNEIVYEGGRGSSRIQGRGMEIKEEEEEEEEEEEYIRECFKNMPVEIILIIFDNLSDGDRWNLACTSSKYMAIFKTWGCFDIIPIFFTKELISVPNHPTLKPIKNEVRSTNFVLTKTSSWELGSVVDYNQPRWFGDFQHDSDDDDQDEHSRNNSYYSHSLNYGYNGFAVFDNEFDASNVIFEDKVMDVDGHNTLALIPIPYSSNKIKTPEIFKSDDWITILAQNGKLRKSLNDVFIHAEFTIHPTDP